jgi:hypothetical protein
MRLSRGWPSGCRHRPVTGRLEWMPGRDARELLHGGGSVVGRGAGPQGAWELRASHDQPDAAGSDGCLAILIDLWDDFGRPAGSGGCGGLGVVTAEQPVCVSMSRRGVGRSICYIGQAVDQTTRVQLALNDGRAADATLLRSELPILLWVGFTDGDAVLTSMRAFGAQQVLGAEEIVEDWPDSRSNVCWGPYVPLIAFTPTGRAATRERPRGGFRSA